MKPRPCWCIDPGLLDFTHAHRFQLEIYEARRENRIDQDVMLFMEHSPVFTVGRRGRHDNLLVSQSFLANAGIGLHHIERGGDITFHGPGQLVLYPIIHLKKAGLGVLGFVERLEEVMIRTAADWGIPAVRDSRNRGVWVGNSKLGSIGIAVRRGITFHGLALNVDLSLEPFSWINPCGLKGVNVTAMNLEADRPVEMDTIKATMRKHLESVFSMSFQDIPMKKMKQMVNQKGTMLKPNGSSSCT